MGGLGKEEGPGHEKEVLTEIDCKNRTVDPCFIRMGDPTGCGPFVSSLSNSKREQYIQGCVNGDQEFRILQTIRDEI